jgi:putative thioredoxin
MHAFSTDVGSADFEESVIAASHRVPVLVDFWAEWCAPCRTLKPILETLAADYGGRFRLAKVNSDQNQELAARYAVRGIPCVKAFIDGAVVGEFTGALPEAQVRAFIDDLLPSPAEPLRIAALEARTRGDTEVACSLLSDALDLDPKHDTARLDLADIRIDLGDTDTAQSILDSIGHSTRFADTAALASRIAANEGDLDARLRLAQALALVGNYRPALEELLSIVKRDRHWQDQAARKAMLDLFTLLGSDGQSDDLVREFRIALARTLN